jgi:hypothetical protein
MWRKIHAKGLDKKAEGKADANTSCYEIDSRIAVKMTLSDRCDDGTGYIFVEEGLDAVGQAEDVVFVLGNIESSDPSDEEEEEADTAPSCRSIIKLGRL